MDHVRARKLIGIVNSREYIRLVSSFFAFLLNPTRIL